MSTINQGEIWLVNFDPSIGSEIQKTRQAVVINDSNMGRLGINIIVPITQYKDFFEQYPWIIKIEPDDTNNLDKTSAFECFQIKSFSSKRFVKKIGEISSQEIHKIHQTVAKTFNPTYEIKW
jgi:mRNA interferase MazF